MGIFYCKQVIYQKILKVYFNFSWSINKLSEIVDFYATSRVGISLTASFLGFEFEVKLTCLFLDVLSLREVWIRLAHRRVPNRKFRYNQPILDARICLGGTYGGFHGCTQLGWRESQPKAIHTEKWCKQLGVLLQQQFRSSRPPQHCGVFTCKNASLMRRLID